jgi:oligopeptidase B
MKKQMKRLIIFGLLIYSQIIVFAQDDLKTSINVKSSYECLKDLFKELEEQTEYTFSYASTVLNDSQEIEINYKCKNILEILELISHEYEVSYKLKNNRILFFKENNIHKEKPVVIVSGQIKDFETNKDVPFVAIQLLGTNKGTSANADGVFEFKMEELTGIDSLVFSCLGYKNNKIAIKDFNSANDKVIYLTPSTIEMNEVVVKPISAVEILQEALDKIPQNYPNKQVVLDAFYRTLLTQNGKYVRLAEAACSFNLASYTDTVDHYSRQKSYFSYNEVMNPDSFIVQKNIGMWDNLFYHYDCHVSEKDKVCIIDSRVSKDHSKTLQKRYLNGGPLGSIASDKVRFRTDFLDTHKIKYYKYKYAGLTSYNNREVYILEFLPKRIQFRLKGKDHRKWIFKHKYKNAELSGKIFIDSKTMAIIGLDYISDTINKRLKETYSVKVDYQLYNGKWYLRQVSKSMADNLPITDDYFFGERNRFETTTNLIVNSIDTTANFKYDSIPPMPYSSFISMYLAAGEYHPEFWKSYNTLLISKLEKKIINDLEKTKSLEEQFSLSQVYDSSMTAPIAHEEITVDTIHGDIRIDPYAWMENKRSNKVLNYLIDENNYTDNYATQFKNLKKELVHEAVMWNDSTEITNKQKVGEHLYFERLSDEGNYPKLFRKKDTLESNEELVFDFNSIAEKYSNYYLVDYQISPDNKYLSITADTTGLEKMYVLFYDLDKKKFINDRLENVVYIIWNKNRNNIFYVPVDSLYRYNKIYSHVLGENQELDSLIYEEKDDIYNVSFTIDKGGRYLILYSGCYVNNEIRYLDMHTGEIKILYSRNNNQFYDISIEDEHTFVLVENDSLNFISKSSLKNPNNLSDTIYCSRDSYIQGFIVKNNFLIIQEVRNAQQTLKVLNLENGEIRFINSRVENPAFQVLQVDSTKLNTIRYNVSSFSQPSQTFEFNLEKNKQKLIKESKTIDNFSNKDYKTEVIFVKSIDEEDIPVTIVYNDKRIKEKPGSEKFRLQEYPMFLNAYGCYGISGSPYFSPILQSLLDRGVIYAYAHVRGGKEKGPKWFHNGNAENKLNTYTDFIDCTKGLIDIGYATKGKIGLYVASAGGVLGGYAINNNPELFKVVVLDVPVCDLLNTLIKARTPFEEAHYKIYGNPNDSVDYFKIKQYSPVENIKKR